MIPCNCKLVSVFAKSLNKPIKDYIISLNKPIKDYIISLNKPIKDYIISLNKPIKDYILEEDVIYTWDCHILKEFQVVF